MLAACGGGPGMDAGYLRNLVEPYPSLLLDWARVDEAGYPLRRSAIQLQAQSDYIEACRKQASKELGLASHDLLLIPVGHSAGGTRAVRWAAQHPELTAGLVLLDAQIIPPVYPYSAFGASLRLMAYAVLHWHGGLEAAFRARFMEIAGQHYFVHPAPENKRAFIAAFVSPFIYLVQESRFALWDVQAELAEVQSPVLFIHGEQDRIISPASAQQQVERLGDRARLCLIPDAGHMPMMEGPVATAEALHTYLSQLGRLSQGANEL